MIFCFFYPIQIARLSCILCYICYFDYCFAFSDSVHFLSIRYIGDDDDSSELMRKARAAEFDAEPSAKRDAQSKRAAQPAAKASVQPASTLVAAQRAAGAVARRVRAANPGRRTGFSGVVPSLLFCPVGGAHRAPFFRTWAGRNSPKT